MANQIFLKATFPGYEPFTTIIKEGLSLRPATDIAQALGLQSPPSTEGQSFLDHQSITLNPKPSKTTLETLQNFSLTTRSLPLGLSLISAIIYLISPLRNLYALILLLAGADFLYTQYLSKRKA